jgi:hypothetical protein
MQPLVIKKAQRAKVKMKMNIGAPTGFGKTTGALMVAYGMVKDWSKICLVDSENESGSFYANHKVPGTNFVIGEFLTISITPPFTVDRFCSSIDMAIAEGCEVVIMDSMYHYWHGTGGILDYVGSLGGRFQDWAKGSPLWVKMMDKILQSPIHVITTTRKKQAYEIVTGSSGKKEVEKKGMEDQVRDGYEYDMTIALEIVSDKHLCKASKDRSGLFMGKQEFVITEEVGKAITEWCNSGAELILPALGENALASALQRISTGEVNLQEKLTKNFKLTEEQLEKIKTAIEEFKQKS